MISQEMKDQIEKEATEYSRRIRQESGIYTFKDCYTTAATKYAEQLEEKEVERAKEQQRGDWFESEFNRMVANKKHEDRELAQLKEIAEKMINYLKDIERCGECHYCSENAGCAIITYAEWCKQIK